MDYISKKDAIRIVSSRIGNEYLAQEINQLPNADVRENIKGEWISIVQGIIYSCPFCKMSVGSKYNFCHKCGADMRERR